MPVKNTLFKNKNFSNLAKLNNDTILTKSMTDIQKYIIKKKKQKEINDKIKQDNKNKLFKIKNLSNLAKLNNDTKLTKSVIDIQKYIIKKKREKKQKEINDKKKQDQYQKRVQDNKNKLDAYHKQLLKDNKNKLYIQQKKQQLLEQQKLNAQQQLVEQQKLLEQKLLKQQQLLEQQKQTQLLKQQQKQLLEQQKQLLEQQKQQQLVEEQQQKQLLEQQQQLLEQQQQQKQLLEPPLLEKYPTLLKQKNIDCKFNSFNITYKIYHFTNNNYLQNKNILTTYNYTYIKKNYDELIELNDFLLILNECIQYNVLIVINFNNSTNYYKIISLINNYTSTNNNYKKNVTIINYINYQIQNIKDRDINTNNTLLIKSQYFKKIINIIDRCNISKYKKHLKNTRIIFKDILKNINKINELYWYKYYFRLPICAYRRLIQFYSTCWFNAILNSFILNQNIIKNILNDAYFTNDNIINTIFQNNSDKHNIKTWDELLQLGSNTIINNYSFQEYCYIFLKILLYYNDPIEHINYMLINYLAFKVKKETQKYKDEIPYSNNIIEYLALKVQQETDKCNSKIQYKYNNNDVIQYVKKGYQIPIPLIYMCKKLFFNTNYLIVYTIPLNIQNDYEFIIVLNNAYKTIQPSIYILDNKYILSSSSIYLNTIHHAVAGFNCNNKYYIYDSRYAYVQKIMWPKYDRLEINNINYTYYISYCIYTKIIR